MSQPPDPGRADNLPCSLRALFGVNVQAEIIAWLLTHESGHPAAIARDTGHFSKSVQHTLNEMEDSGHIRSRRDGRENIFWLKPGAWEVLITWSHPSGVPRWVCVYKNPGFLYRVAGMGMNIKSQAFYREFSCRVDGERVGWRAWG